MPKHYPALGLEPDDPVHYVVPREGYVLGQIYEYRDLELECVRLFDDEALLKVLSPYRPKIGVWHCSHCDDVVPQHALNEEPPVCAACGTLREWTED